MICPKCGKDNKDVYRFCVMCGTKLEMPPERPEAYSMPPEDNMVKELDLNGFENEETMDLDDKAAFENDETVMLDDFTAFENDETVMLDDFTAFENDETVILDDVEAFENDETVILDDVAAFENDETVMLVDDRAFENDETVILDEQEAPSFHFRSIYKEEPAPPAPAYTAPPAKDDMAYIEHLRRLKELLDDGIITEDEFRRKKAQILGI